jgi:hypothetical protein
MELPCKRLEVKSDNAKKGIVMDWITKEQVKEAAKDKMTALECSLKHHQQGMDCTRGELVSAIDNNAFSLSDLYCACCVFFKKSSENRTCEHDCPLFLPSKATTMHNSECCGNLWWESHMAMEAFAKNPTVDNCVAFQKVEANICDYIQQAIDDAKAKIAELDKPKLRHGDYYGESTTRVIVMENYDNEGMWDFRHKDGSGDTRTEKQVLMHLGRLPRLGNIFDDIAERGKELDSFKAVSDEDSDDWVEFQPRISSIGETLIRLIATEDEDVAVVDYSIPEAEEIHRKLGQVINYAKKQSLKD